MPEDEAKIRFVIEDESKVESPTPDTPVEPISTGSSAEMDVTKSEDLLSSAWEDFLEKSREKLGQLEVDLQESVDTSELEPTLPTAMRFDPDDEEVKEASSEGLEVLEDQKDILSDIRDLLEKQTEEKPEEVEPPLVPTAEPSLTDSLKNLFSERGAGAIPGAIGGAVGGATGSGTAGMLAGAASGEVLGRLALSSGPAVKKATLALGAVAIAGVVVKESFEKLHSIADELATSIEDISPEVATEKAEAEIRLLEHELRRAGELGESLGEFVQAQTDLHLEVESLKDYVIKEAGPSLIEGLKVTKDILAGIGTLLEIVPPPIVLILKYLPMLTNLSPLIALTRIKEKLEELGWLQDEHGEGSVFDDPAIKGFLDPTTEGVDIIGNPNIRGGNIRGVGI